MEALVISDALMEERLSPGNFIRILDFPNELRFPTNREPDCPAEPALLLIVISSIAPFVLISSPLLTRSGYAVFSSALYSSERARRSTYSSRGTTGSKGVCKQPVVAVVRSKNDGVAYISDSLLFRIAQQQLPRSILI